MMNYGQQGMVCYEEDLPREVLDLLAAGFSDCPESKSDSADDNTWEVLNEERTIQNAHARKYSEFAAEYIDDRQNHPVNNRPIQTLQPLRKPQSIIPQPVIQDVRKFYSQMFVNTMNSGDINQIQSFFKTFMAGPCKCAVQHRINQAYGLPQFLNVTGPDKFAHYLMGCFLTFPDMIFQLDSAKVVVSKDWKGSRIIMQTQIFGSKLREIAEYPWSPEVDSLSALYGEMRVTPKAKVRKCVTNNQTDHFTQVNQINQSRHDDVCHSPERKTSRSSSISSINSGSSPSTSSSGASSPTSSYSQPGILSSHLVGGSGSTSLYGATSCDTSYGSGISLQPNSKGPGRPKLAISTQAPYAREVPAPPRSPTQYMNMVIDQSRVLANPLQLHTRGTITLYLDEHNVMQYVLCEQNSV